MTDTRWTCRCGATELAVKPGTGVRIVCYCKDCQGFARHLGSDETLDASGGTDIYATQADRLSIVKGEGNLKALRMTPKGPFRWYAGCCGTPLANGLTKAAFPFASLILNERSDRDAFGPVRFRVNTEAARGEVPKKRGSLVHLVWSVMSRGFVAMITGRSRPTPFFDDAGVPVADVQLLTKEERRAALP